MAASLSLLLQRSMKIAYSTALHILATGSSIATRRKAAALQSPFLPSISINKVMVLTRNQFAQFAHPGGSADNKDDVPSASAPLRSSRFNRVVSPSPMQKRKAQGDGASSKKSSPPKKKAKNSTTKRTASFGAVTAANFTDVEEDIPQVHTLLLGTHPSIASLQESQYYGHDMNTFWWIVGDCLGFRRRKGLKANGKEYFGFTEHLRYDESHIISYEEQVKKVCFKGFALWDIVKECKRPGSLDSDITNEVPNDIRGFCESHPSVKRIVLSNGGTGCSFFKKHFKEWLDSGELVPSDNKTSQDALKKWNKKNKLRKKGQRQIECLVAMPVSPAAARYTYTEKRDFWEKYVYKPGLKDFEAASKGQR